jgi:hypothetical protein
MLTGNGLCVFISFCMLGALMMVGYVINVVDKEDEE